MPIFLLVFVGTMVISLLAQWRVQRMFRRFSEVPGSRGYCGAEVASAMMRQAGIHDVEIVSQEGMLGDHYDPLNKRLVLSEENYSGTSLAAIGVAAHEAGHALQHQAAYFPLHLRMGAVTATNFASQIVSIVPLIGMFTHVLSTYTGLMIMALGWGVIMAFNLITLPVEFDASNRAKKALVNLGFVADSSESAGVARVLNAAALTYVAAFITSALYFLMYLLPLLSGGRSDRDRD